MKDVCENKSVPVSFDKRPRRLNFVYFVIWSQRFGFIKGGESDPYFASLSRHIDTMA